VKGLEIVSEQMFLIYDLRVSTGCPEINAMRKMKKSLGPPKEKFE
jgi:hypothetical protein